jgi:hypothetical protein
MNHDIAHRVSAAWAQDATVRIGAAVWTLHLCGVIEVEGARVLSVVACGPRRRWLEVTVSEARRRLTSLDVTQAIADHLGAADDEESTLSFDMTRLVA